jgi:hypothetical protein
MDMNAYVIETLSRYQLAERHAAAEVMSQVRAAAPPRRPLRVTLGLALIRVGTWALGPRDRRSGAPSVLSG